MDAATALLAGLAPDGGLYVPVEIPHLDPELLRKGPMAFPELMFRVIRPFFSSLPEAALRVSVERAASLFDTEAVAPLVHAGGLHVLELFHGPTLAFKDIALTLFGSLLSLAREVSGQREKLIVIVATSGDTGSAALSGLEGLPGVRVVVIYPSEGVSEVQRLQMTTRDSPDSLVLGVKGTFDDAQRIAKKLLVDPAARARFAAAGYSPCSANSINVGRLIPQISYYVHSFRELGAAGLLGPSGLMDVAVPSGNFGNVLAAWYARRMGLPIGNFLVSTNRNRVLADFLQTGSYDRNRAFHITTSPSMDILVSSNVERLLFEATGCDAQRTAVLMSSLASEGRYSLTAAERAAFADFRGYAVDDEAASQEIGRVFSESGYLLDPHTATAAAALRALGTINPTVITATASPFKFAGTVARAIGAEAADGSTESEFATLARVAAKAGLSLPPLLTGLESKVERHKRSLSPADIPSAIDLWLQDS